MTRNFIRLCRRIGVVNACRLSMVGDQPEIRLCHESFGALLLRRDGSDREVFRHVFLDRCYDVPKFQKLIPGFRPRTIVDAGANIGLATVYFRAKYPDSTIVAIEPDRDNFRLLEANAGGRRDVHLLRGALWHENVTLRLSNPASEAYARRFDTVSGESDVESVTAITPSHIMEKYRLDGIDIFKIDIEGAEKELFSTGSEDWLAKTNVLIIETHDILKPGCARAVNVATSRHDFCQFHYDENLILIKESLLSGWRRAQA